MADYNIAVFPFKFPALFYVRGEAFIYTIFSFIFPAWFVGADPVEPTQMTFFPFTFPSWFVHEPD